MGNCRSYILLLYSLDRNKYWWNQLSCQTPCRLIARVYTYPLVASMNSMVNKGMSVTIRVIRNDPAGTRGIAHLAISLISTIRAYIYYAVVDSLYEQKRSISFLEVAWLHRGNNRYELSSKCTFHFASNKTFRRAYDDTLAGTCWIYGVLVFARLFVRAKLARVWHYSWWPRTHVSYARRERVFCSPLLLAQWLVTMYDAELKLVIEETVNTLVEKKKRRRRRKEELTINKNNDCFSTSVLCLIDICQSWYSPCSLHTDVLSQSLMRKGRRWCTKKKYDDVQNRCVLRFQHENDHSTFYESHSRVFTFEFWHSCFTLSFNITICQNNPLYSFLAGCKA